MFRLDFIHIGSTYKYTYVQCCFWPALNTTHLSLKTYHMNTHRLDTFTFAACYAFCFIIAIKVRIWLGLPSGLFMLCCIWVNLKECSRRYTISQYLSKHSSGQLDTLYFFTSVSVIAMAYFAENFFALILNSEIMAIRRPDHILFLNSVVTT